MADTTGSFVPNKNPKKKTDNPVLKEMPAAAAADAATKTGVGVITGRANPREPLTGDKLAKFTTLYKGSAVIRGMFNPDGTKQASTKLLTD